MNAATDFVEGGGRLGKVLTKAGAISDDQLQIALTEQQRSEEPLGRILVRLGFLSEKILRDALGQVLGRESIDLRQHLPDAQALAMLPVSLARRYQVVPVAYDEKRRCLRLASADVYNMFVSEQLQAVVGEAVTVETLLAGEQEIDDALDRFYGYELSVDGILREIETGESSYEELDEEVEHSHPVVRLVNAILADAVKRRASDIHFEPEESFLRIRYRIDGVLRQIRSLHRNHWSPITIRLKVLSGMNIAENRAPQDGRFSLSSSGSLIDFRVSSVRTIWGENIVLRILDRRKGIIALDGLGLQPHQLQQLQLMMARPEGVIIMTGPTGSGKTTTLYSLLNTLNEEGVNIMTLEDPVEYPINMIRQCLVNEAVQFGFGSGIRSLMRQDPDIILVGEIRDEESAEMAFRAAMTGHQVYTTLHSNSALGALPRLRDIGISAEVMEGSIIGILGQRLVRRLCRHCRQPYRASEEQARLLKKPLSSVLELHRAVGCERCEKQGYYGRMALMEVVRIDDDLDELIARQASQKSFLQLLHEKDFQDLVQDAISRVLAGDTSLEEVSRVVNMTRHL